MLFRAISVAIAWLAFAFLTLTNPAVGQSPIAGFPPGTFQSRAAIDASTSGCAEATNFIARTSGLDATHQSRYTTLICGLVTDGVFAKLDALYIFTTDTTTNALLNLVQNSFNGAVTGTLTFTANVGYTGDAATGFIDSGFNALTGGQYTQNSASYGTYILSSRSADQIWASMGYDNVAASRIFPLIFGTVRYGVNGTAGVLGLVNTNAQGFWYGVRNGSSTTSIIYKNGSAFSTDADVSTTRDSLNIYIFASNEAGASFFTGDQMSAAFIGGALSATDASNLSLRINAYMTAYGINVY